MGLKSFLQQQGFIAKEEPLTEGNTVKSSTAPTPPPLPMAPVIFPSQEAAATPVAAQPSFVQSPAAATAPASEVVDPAFIKFYEDELVKANLAGPDYFEFRQQMNVMNQKLSGKGVTEDIILQTVLTSFEAQNIPASKLAESARFYKNALNEKKDGFLKGAAGERENQLQRRNGALQSHQSSIDQMTRQLQDLKNQIQRLEQNIAKEQTQMEVDKTMGKEGIEKIERAERQIALAFTYITGTIDKDLALLQSHQ